jgi:large subunit ribosomal protein L9
MKLVLMEEVPSLGKIGDIVVVADGYARNYLIPKRLAVVESKGTLRQIENIKKLKANRQEKLLYGFKELSEKIDGISIDLPVETGDEDKIFGTVNSIMIADALKEKGFDIDRKKIEIETPIKSLGVYNVSIKLHEEFEPKIKVWVIRK